MTLQRRDLLTLLLGVACGGCTSWKDTSTEPLDLPATRMSPDAVALEITFVRIPAGHPVANTELWQSADEQVLPVQQRLHLTDNGFRVGLMGAQLPDSLRELLKQQQEVASIDEAVTADMDLLANNRRVHVRSGKRTEIVATDLRDQVIVLYREPNQERVGGRTFADAQCKFAAKAITNGDGSIRLQMVPEVHHGPIHNQWVPGHGTFRTMAGRKREVFQHLAFEAQLNPGQTLIVSCTPEMTGVGHTFFVESGEGDAQQKLLLIRLAQSQRNALFD